MSAVDRPCRNCNGTGERIVVEPMPVPEMEGQDVLIPTKKIIECMICLGTGIEEVDTYWDE